MDNLKTALVCFLACLACAGLAGAWHCRDKAAAAEAEAGRLRTERDAARTEAASWRLMADQANKGALALETQAQSCLDREAGARADADAWKALLDQAAQREMTPKEKEGVPDDATRSVLFDALDRPL